MAIVGANTVKMDKLAGDIKGKWEQIHRLKTSLDSDFAKSKSIWVGPDADKMRSEWIQIPSAQLDKVVTRLKHAEERIHVNSTAQKQASQA